MIADACNFACDEIYDFRLQDWKSLGTTEPTLFISTEQDETELTTMELSFLSGVNEDHIVKGEYLDGEWDRVTKAASVLNRSALIMKTMPNFSLQDIENTIKMAIKQYGVKYIILDYIHSSAKILSEVSGASGVKGLREDNVLFLISVKLKEICTEYNVFILSSTQLNGDYRQAKVYDQNLLRGAKSLADKIDAGMLMLDVTPEDIDKLSPIVNKKKCAMPNVKMSIYKNRASKYKNILIWMVANKGVCRFDPIFITDYNFELLDVEDTQITVVPNNG